MREMQLARAFLVDFQFSSNPTSVAGTGLDPLSFDFQKFLSANNNKFITLTSVVFAFLGNLNGDTINELITRLMAAGITALALAYLFISISWYLVMTNYKKDIFSVRVGEYQRVLQGQTDKKQFSFGPAGEVPGIVIWRTFMGFVLVFFFCLLLVFIISWGWFWNWVWGFGESYILSVAGIFLVVKGLKMLIVRFSVTPTWIKHRRIFALYDLGVLYMGLYVLCSSFFFFFFY
jgi:hypothetical protein